MDRPLIYTPNTILANKGTLTHPVQKIERKENKFKYVMTIAYPSIYFNFMGV
jgi:hypothetical protein